MHQKKLYFLLIRINLELICIFFSFIFGANLEKKKQLLVNLNVSFGREVSEQADQCGNLSPDYFFSCVLWRPGVRR